MKRCNKSRRVYFQQIINATDCLINLYDSNGNIATCAPWRNLTKLAQPLQPDTMVIVEDEYYAATNDIPKENAVVARSTGVGHDKDKRMYRLIRPYDKAIVTIDPPPGQKAEAYHI